MPFLRIFSYFFCEEADSYTITVGAEIFLLNSGQTEVIACATKKYIATV